MTEQANFYIGQIVVHQLFAYRGVIYGIDPVFMLSNEWYEQMARSRPPKDKPWYQVLVDNAIHTTYVAEANLKTEANPEPIWHPAVNDMFEYFKNGKYHLQKNRLQ